MPAFLWLEALTPPDLIALVTGDPVAVILLYLVILLAVVGVNQAGKGRGNLPPFGYINSIFIYLLGIPGIMSLVLWGYTMTFESKRIDELNMYAYYLPLVAMFAGFFVISRNANFSRLPWFGELAELLVLIAVSFAFVLLFMQLGVLRFSSVFPLFAVFAALFLVFKLIWDKLQRMMH